MAGKAAAATKKVATTKKTTKTTPAARKAPITKKATTKKTTTKKVAKKQTVKKETAEKVQRNRHFSVVYEGQILTAVPSGKRPKQAANKALTAIFKTFKDDEKVKMIGKDIHFALYENCKRKKNAKGDVIPRRVFQYTGIRSETKHTDNDKPITHEVITYCDDCKKRIEELTTIDKDNVITKKQVMANIKLIKKSVKYQKEGKKDKDGKLIVIELNEHIKKFRKAYDAVIDCKGCTKKDKVIEYKYTNSVKKTEDAALSAEDKKITSEWIDTQIAKAKEEEDKKKETKEPEKVEKTETKKPATKKGAKKN